MSALLVPAVLGAILGAYCLIEDVLWACKSKPMARPLTKRQLRCRYKQRLHAVVALERLTRQ